MLIIGREVIDGRKHTGEEVAAQTGMRVAVLNAPQGYMEKLDTEAATGLGSTEGSLDFVQMFVKTLKELEALVPGAKQALKYDGLFWVCYPKGGSKIETDLNRDIIWRAVSKFGLSAIAMVSVDDVWSAMRLRPAEKVGK